MRTWTYSVSQCQYENINTTVTIIVTDYDDGDSGINRISIVAVTYNGVIPATIQRMLHLYAIYQYGIDAVHG